MSFVISPSTAAMVRNAFQPRPAGGEPSEGKGHLASGVLAAWATQLELC